MNKKTAARLLGLMEVKTQVEKTGSAVLARRQKAAFDEAEALKRAAAEAAPAAARAPSSSALGQAAAYCARTYAAARGRRRDGETLESDKQRQRTEVHAALQREIAAERLLKAAEAEDRKRRENAEEVSRELTLSARTAGS